MDGSYARLNLILIGEIFLIAYLSFVIIYFFHIRKVKSQVEKLFIKETKEAEEKM